MPGLRPPAPIIVGADPLPGSTDPIRAGGRIRAGAGAGNGLAGGQALTLTEIGAGKLGARQTFMGDGTGWEHRFARQLNAGAAPVDVLSIYDTGAIIPVAPPAGPIVADLGAPTRPWRNIYASGGVTAATLAASGPAGTVRGVQFQTANVARFQTYLDTAAESGGGIGSNWTLARYSDAGAFLGTSIVVARGNGNIYLATGGGVLVVGPTDTAVGGGERVRVDGETILQANSTRALAVRALTGSADVLRVDAQAGVVFGYRLSIGSSNTWTANLFEVDPVAQAVFVGTGSAPGNGLAVRKAISVGLVGGTDIGGPETIKVARSALVISRINENPVLKLDCISQQAGGVEYYENGGFMGAVYGYNYGRRMFFRWGAAAADTGFEWGSADGLSVYMKLLAYGGGARARWTLNGDLELTNPQTTPAAGAPWGYIIAYLNNTPVKIPYYQIA